MIISGGEELTRRWKHWPKLTQPLKHSWGWAVGFSLVYLALGMLAAFGTLRQWGFGSENLPLQPIWAAACWAIAAKFFTRRGVERGMAWWHALVPILLVLPAAATLLSLPWFPAPWPDITAGAIAALVVVVEGPRIRNEARELDIEVDIVLCACLGVALIAVSGLVVRWP